MARSITIKPKDYGFALAALRQQSRPRADDSAARAEIERQERAVERQRYKHHLAIESQRGNSRSEAHEAARSLARSDAQDHWRRATEHFEQHGSVPSMSRGGVAAPARPTPTRPAQPQPANPTHSAQRADSGHDIRAQIHKQLEPRNLQKIRGLEHTAARSGNIGDHRAAARAHRSHAIDKRHAGEHAGAPRHETAHRVHDRAAAVAKAHGQQTLTKAAQKKTGMRKNPEPKGPTQRGPKGGTYRLVNGRKEYVGGKGK